MNNALPDDDDEMIIMDDFTKDELFSYIGRQLFENTMLKKRLAKLGERNMELSLQIQEQAIKMANQSAPLEISERDQYKAGLDDGIHVCQAQIDFQRERLNVQTLTLADTKEAQTLIGAFSESIRIINSLKKEVT